MTKSTMVEKAYVIVISFLVIMLIIMSIDNDKYQLRTTLLTYQLIQHEKNERKLYLIKDNVSGLFEKYNIDLKNEKIMLVGIICYYNEYDSRYTKLYSNEIKCLNELAGKYPNNVTVIVKKDQNNIWRRNRVKYPFRQVEEYGDVSDSLPVFVALINRDREMLYYHEAKIDDEILYKEFYKKVNKIFKLAYEK